MRWNNYCGAWRKKKRFLLIPKTLVNPVSKAMETRWLEYSEFWQHKEYESGLWTGERSLRWIDIEWYSSLVDDPESREKKEKSRK